MGAAAPYVNRCPPPPEPALVPGAGGLLLAGRAEYQDLQNRIAVLEAQVFHGSPMMPGVIFFSPSSTQWVDMHQGRPSSPLMSEPA